MNSAQKDSLIRERERLQKRLGEIGNRLAEADKWEGWTFREEGVKCGCENCKCRKGEPHGKYWYGYRRVDGKLKKSYVGKDLFKWKEKNKNLDSPNSEINESRKIVGNEFKPSSRKRPAKGKESSYKIPQFSSAYLETLSGMDAVRKVGELDSVFVKKSWAKKRMRPLNLFGQPLKVHGFRWGSGKSGADFLVQREGGRKVWLNGFWLCERTPDGTVSPIVY